MNSSESTSSSVLCEDGNETTSERSAVQLPTCRQMYRQLVELVRAQKRTIASNEHEIRGRRSLNLDSAYCAHWSLPNAVREFMQNWRDGLLELFDNDQEEARLRIRYTDKEESDDYTSFAYRAYYLDARQKRLLLGQVHYRRRRLRGQVHHELCVENEYTALSTSILLMGCSSKNGRDGSRRAYAGGFGEGLKIGILRLVRTAGFEVVYDTGERRWTFELQGTANNRRELCVRTSPLKETMKNRRRSTCVTVRWPVAAGLDVHGVFEPNTYAWLTGTFTNEKRRAKGVIETPRGHLIVDRSQSGWVLIKGIRVHHVPSYLSNGVGLWSDELHMHMGRDRNQVHQHYIRAQMNAVLNSIQTNRISHGDNYRRVAAFLYDRLDTPEVGQQMSVWIDCSRVTLLSAQSWIAMVRYEFDRRHADKKRRREEPEKSVFVYDRKNRHEESAIREDLDMKPVGVSEHVLRVLRAHESRRFPTLDEYVQRMFLQSPRVDCREQHPVFWRRLCLFFEHVRSLCKDKRTQMKLFSLEACDNSVLFHDTTVSTRCRFVNNCFHFNSFLLPAADASHESPHEGSTVMSPLRIVCTLILFELGKSMDLDQRLRVEHHLFDLCNGLEHAHEHYAHIVHMPLKRKHARVANDDDDEEKKNDDNSNERNEEPETKRQRRQSRVERTLLPRDDTRDRQQEVPAAASTAGNRAQTSQPAAPIQFEPRVLTRFSDDDDDGQKTAMDEEENDTEAGRNMHQVPRELFLIKNGAKDSLCSLPYAMYGCVRVAQGETYETHFTQCSRTAIEETVRALEFLFTRVYRRQCTRLPIYVFYDRQSETNAFNRSAKTDRFQLWFNAAQYERAMVTKHADARAFWFSTVAHELAHNEHVRHNALFADHMGYIIRSHTGAFLRAMNEK